MEPNEVLTLLCNTGKGFSGSKNEKSGNNAAQSCVVTALGFKPKTFSSVVRCSIQLSYAASMLLCIHFPKTFPTCGRDALFS